MKDYYLEEINSIKNKIIIVLLCTIFGILLLIYFTRSADSKDYTNEKIADAIYLAEGGKKARVLYGILSIKTTNPKQVCLNTIKNHRLRHKKHSCKLDFIVCLGNRYCPSSVDFIGNRNWIRNVNKFLERK